ncbi:hypothetical protein LY76DRAFT_687110 [Colletotrichum caudatum]|nr:hypothetical protein LY76DRAFT_687110 [Colletotrichum caudatum]
MIPRVVTDSYSSIADLARRHKIQQVFEMKEAAGSSGRVDRRFRGRQVRRFTEHLRSDNPKHPVFTCLDECDPDHKVLELLGWRDDVAADEEQWLPSWETPGQFQSWLKNNLRKWRAELDKAKLLARSDSVGESGGEGEGEWPGQQHPTIMPGGFPTEGGGSIGEEQDMRQPSELTNNLALNSSGRGIQSSNGQTSIRNKEPVGRLGSGSIVTRAREATRQAAGSTWPAQRRRPVLWTPGVPKEVDGGEGRTGDEEGADAVAIRRRAADVGLATREGRQEFLQWYRDVYRKKRR